MRGLAVLGLVLAGVPRAEYVRRHKASFLAGRGPVEVLVPYKDGGLAAPAKPLDTAVSPDDWAAALQGVVGSGESRFIFAPDMPKVMDYLGHKLGDKTTREKFTVQAAWGKKGGDAWNLVDVVEGAEAGFVVLGAHYDSVPPTGKSPGAEDNGSGVAALLSIAAKLRKGGQPKHSVYFVLFSAEEEGLLGSEAFAQELVQQKKAKDCKGAIVLDEVAFSRMDAEKVIFETSGRNDNNQRIVDTLARSSKDKTPHIDFMVNYGGFGSDHMSFLDRGMPAVLVIERDNLFYADNYAHTPKDVIANTRPKFGADISTLVGRAVWDLANA